MQLIVQTYQVRVGHISFQVPMDSNVLSLGYNEHLDIFECHVAQPVGSKNRKLDTVNIGIEATGTMMDYRGQIEYIGSVYRTTMRQWYHGYLIIPPPKEL